jgi:FMN phosphatase YigB (HAD superfamily)
MAYTPDNKVSSIVLDLDGTLYPESNEHLACDAWMQRIDLYLNKHIPDASSNQSFKRMMARCARERKISKLIVEACKAFGIKLKPFAEYIYDIKPDDAKLRRDIKLSKALSMASEDHALYLFTNSYTNWVEKALRSIGVSDIFPRRAITDFSDLCFNIKPSQESFRILLKRARCGKDDIVFLDNSISNVRAAAKFGICSRLVRNSGTNGRGQLYEILESYSYK